MRIAILVDQFPRLSETFILNQVTGLIDRGHEVDVYPIRESDIGSHREEAERYQLAQRTHCPPEFPVNRAWRYIKGLGLLAGHAWKNPPAARACLNVLRYGRPAASMNLFYRAVPFLGRQPYDIIHGHYGPSGLRGDLMRQLGASDGALVTTFYGKDISAHVRRYGGDVYRDLFERGNRFLVLSTCMKERLVALGCDPQRIVIHHLGIDCRRFPFRSQPNTTSGPRRILTIARMVEKKGLAYGLEAVAQLVRGARAIEYHIIGDGVLRPDIEARIASFRLHDVVQLHGWCEQHEVRQMLASSDMLLVPSVTAADGDEEGTPTVILEALACGLPVVATRHSGIPGMLPEPHRTLLAPERDPEALAEALAHLLDRPQFRKELAHPGRMHVEREYDINMLNDRLVEIYETACRASGGMPPLVMPHAITGDDSAGARRAAA